MRSPRFLLPSLLAVALAACGGSSDELNPDDAALLGEAAPADAGVVAPVSAAAPPVAAQVVEQVVLSKDAVLVGSALNTDGAVSAAKPEYAVGDTVYASVPVGGHAPGKEVAIYWFSEKGASIKNERKPILAGANFVSFSLSKADGMEAGGYTVQADIGDAPVGMADFTVK
ncbi:hypothetical protein [Stenotrophomonas nitritireducens]|uniref:hypothetical protein n=1 Tax=Stenotrophomonas nitritireducens TaxID=83617 RepID=UPI000AFE7D92|nr:hypothetical protein [Stenotrophomonas nitritireducens]